MADFYQKLYDDNAVTTFLKRYQDCEREIQMAKSRLLRLERQAESDARYINTAISAAIEEDRQRITERMETAEAVKREVLELLDLLPDGEERRVLELYYIADLSIGQLCDKLYCSRATVFRAKDRGIKMLLDRLADK